MLTPFEKQQLKIFNRKIIILLFLLLIPFLVGVWWLNNFFKYDICASKAISTVPRDQLRQMYTPTSEEIKTHSDLITTESKITGFYRGVLECYRQGEQRFKIYF